MPQPVVNERDVLRYFEAHGPGYSRGIEKTEPFISQLAAGEIQLHNIQRAIYRCVRKGTLQARGIKKGRVYRITDAGRAYLKTRGSDSSAS